MNKRGECTSATENMVAELVREEPLRGQLETLLDPAGLAQAPCFSGDMLNGNQARCSSTDHKSNGVDRAPGQQPENAAGTGGHVHPQEIQSQDTAGL